MISLSRLLTRRKPRPRMRRRLRFEPLEPRLPLSTFYVDPNGDDAALGTEDAPWQTLQRAADAVAPGDTVVVRAGEYAGFNLTTSGTPDQPITFQADPGVVIDGPNSWNGLDGINLEGASYAVIDGFTVIGMPRAGIRSVLNQGVTIRNNITDENGVWGIFTGWSEDVTIEHNVASRSVTEHGIYVSNSADNPVIRSNIVWGNYASGIQINADASAVWDGQDNDGIITGALVEGNIIYDNGWGGGAALNNDGVQDSVFRNNLLYGNHASGIVLYAADGADGSKNNLVVNNTIVNADDGRWAVYIQSGSTGNTLLNNVLYSGHWYRGSIDIGPDSLPGFTSDYNVVMDRFTLDDGDSRLSLADWQAATGQDEHSIMATPDELFVDPWSGDYHLAAASPAIDAGTSFDAPDVDLEGRPRADGAGWDIGAYES
ncbi:MAG: right-handed parallel beta-helix repeat-containing protein [Isosphaeraceae bacterium]|nr:right-handed parallel beta-helix repeat-containing protein [Isosphaeraceae bacterium]